MPHTFKVPILILHHTIPLITLYKTAHGHVCIGGDDGCDWHRIKAGVAPGFAIGLLFQGVVPIIHFCEKMTDDSIWPFID